jgi:hypothetical protein
VNPLSLVSNVNVVQLVESTANAGAATTPEDILFFAAPARSAVAGERSARLAGISNKKTEKRIRAKIDPVWALI